MQIDKLVLHNFRCFENLEISFDSQLTVLVAENGGGKSAILDALAIMIRALLRSVTTMKRPTLQSSDFRTELVRTGVGATREPAIFEPVVLQMMALLGDQELDLRCIRPRQSAQTKISSPTPVTKYLEFFKHETANEDDHQILPVVGYYGIGRLEKSGNSLSGIGEPFLGERLNGYKHCLDANSRLQPFSNWFTRASNSVHLSRFDPTSVPKHLFRDVGYLEGAVRNIKDAINHVLRPYGDCWFTNHFHTGETVLDDLSRMRSLRPEQLSHGVRVMLATVGDIALRASILNPHLGTRAARESPGIVLIDEVDMHLHPSWQQLVLKRFQEAFPRVQFIVSTHSPQVLTTINSSQIRVIRYDDIGWHAEMPMVSPLGQESSDALANVMDVNAKPPLEIVKTAHEYELLIRGGAGESTQARQLKRKLDEAGYQIPEAQLSLWRFLAEQSGIKEDG